MAKRQGPVSIFETSSSVSLHKLVDNEILSYEPLTYEDFLPLSAGGIFNSNLGSVSQSNQLIVTAGPDILGFQQCLGAPVADEFDLYFKMQLESLEICRQQLSLREITV